MEPIILAAGSAVGAFTAMALDKVKGNAKPIRNNHVPFTNPNSVELQRRIVMEAMNRVYDYERQGKITGIEREKLLAKYRQEVNMLDNKMYSVALYDLKEVSTFKENLAAVVDQRMAQINARLDDLSSKISSNAPAVQSKPMASVERKEEKRIEVAKPELVQIENMESAESDASLDEIKKQIMQTLSRLEQAEVE